MKVLVFFSVLAALLAVFPEQSFSQSFEVADSIRSIEISKAGDEKERLVGHYILGFVPLYDSENKKIASFAGISDPDGPPTLWIEHLQSGFSFESNDSANRAHNLFRRCASSEHPVMVTVDLSTGKVIKLVASKCKPF
jgi:hypothetical protein